eukprot:303464-Chlamydomonas_euryale.AAC.1
MAVVYARGAEVACAGWGVRAYGSCMRLHSRGEGVKVAAARGVKVAAARGVKVAAAGWMCACKLYEWEGRENGKGERMGREREWEGLASTQGVKEGEAWGSTCLDRDSPPLPLHPHPVRPPHRQTTFPAARHTQPLQPPQTSTRPRSHPPAARDRKNTTTHPPTARTRTPRPRQPRARSMRSVRARRPRRRRTPRSAQPTASATP